MHWLQEALEGRTVWEGITFDGEVALNIIVDHSEQGAGFADGDFDVVLDEDGEWVAAGCDGEACGAEQGRGAGDQGVRLVGPRLWG